MVIEAVTVVPVGVPVIVPLTPVLPETTAVAPVKFVPAKVTGNVVPTVPVDGVTEVSVGAPAATVNAMVTFCVPTLRPRVVAPVVAPPAMVIDAVTVVAVGVPVIVPLMPALPETTAVAPVKFAPVKVTGNVVPTAPVDGVTELS